MIEEERVIECCDDRFEIIARARKHIIEATNIEMSPKEMEVLDNFLFRCWQMGWLKNDYKELEKENAELKAEIENLKKTYRKQRNKRIDELQKENAELKKEISVLLSCSNCSDNKGGYICDKEYNDKCLAQKIEHIKELKEENAELKEQIDQ